MSRKQSSSDNTPRASKGRKASGSKVRSAIVIALAIFIVATFVLAQVNTKRKSAKASNDVLVVNPSAGSPAKEKPVPQRQGRASLGRKRRPPKIRASLSSISAGRRGGDDLNHCGR